MAKKIDLSKLHQEIENRKGEQLKISNNLGETHLNVGQAKDMFLHNLLRSLDSGVNTSATEKIKLVEDLTAKKLNEKPTTRRQVPTQQPIGEDVDREDLLWENIQKSRKSTLADSLENYNMNEQQNYQQYQQFHQYQQPQYNNQMLNEGQLINIVEQVMSKYIGENFTSMIEESIKNVMFDIYAAEKIKDALEENKSMIRKEILSVLKELSNKKK